MPGDRGEALVRLRGEALQAEVLAASLNTWAIRFAVQERLADRRVETRASSQTRRCRANHRRAPQSDSPIAVRVPSFVRGQANPNSSLVSVPKVKDAGEVDQERSRPPLPFGLRGIARRGRRKRQRPGGRKRTLGGG